MAQQPLKGERAPLKDDLWVDDFCNHCTKAYGKGSHAEFIPGGYGITQVIKNYEPLKFSSFRVLFAWKGTVFQDSVLVIEQVIIFGLFAAAALPVYIWFNQEAGVGKDGMSTRKWLDRQEGRMRAFALIMMGFTSLLLSFYTAMAVGRWWIIRTAGVGGIKSAQMDLTMLVSTNVTKDETVLKSIRKYARASLILVFLWRRKQVGPKVDKETARGHMQCLVDDNILDQDEVNCLCEWNHCMHETIWAWQTAIICMLYQEGLIKSDQLLRTLLEKCSEGRSAVQCIHTHLAVRIPMQYVHLLGLLVKMHNFVLAVIMGSLFGAALRDAEIIICVQLIGRTMILPVLFNAILLINAELADPFDGHPTDFPGKLYQQGLENDGAAFVSAATNNVPNWLANRRTRMGQQV